MRTIIIVVTLLAVVLGGYYFAKNDEEMVIVGGDRDDYGCLVPAGYSYNEEIGACARTFELTPDIIQAAKLAVKEVGEGYALTVASFNSYEEVGSYDIIFERGEERDQETVRIKNWEVISGSVLE